ncbi:MAG: toll/interleukin-1 receptor domain-containing protein [Verrucomicrobiaceae bacterium]|nr:toll/interleukin-1 receptor domain-containing protein [Verrucomicrobiaceae bacterium]
MAHDVFISYSSKDKPVADAVCAVLEGDGARCWIAPRDVAPGAVWGASIVEAIEGARVMVLVFSANSNASQQVLNEVERAVSKGVIIIPLRIDDVPMSKAMEYFISSKHWLDALTPPLESHLRKLSTTVKAILGGAGEIPPVQGSSSPGPATLLIAVTYLRDLARRRTFAFACLCAGFFAMLALMVRLVLHGASPTPVFPGLPGGPPEQMPAFSPPPPDLARLQDAVTAEIRRIGGPSPTPEDSELMFSFTKETTRATGLMLMQKHQEARALLEKLLPEVTRAAAAQTARKAAGPLLTRVRMMAACRRIVGGENAAAPFVQALTQVEKDLACAAPEKVTQLLGAMDAKIAAAQTIEEKVFIGSFFSADAPDYTWAKGSTEELADFASRYHAGWLAEVWGLRLGMTLDEIQDWCAAHGLAYMGFHTNLIMSPPGDAYMGEVRKRIPLARLENGAVDLSIDMELTPHLADDLPERVHAMEITCTLAGARTKGEVTAYLEKLLGPPLRRTEYEWAYRGNCVPSPPDKREALLPELKVEVATSPSHHFKVRSSDQRLRAHYERTYAGLIKASKRPDDLPVGPAMRKFVAARKEIAARVLKVDFRGMHLGQAGSEAMATSTRLTDKGFKWSPSSTQTNIIGSRKDAATGEEELLDVTITKAPAGGPIPSSVTKINHEAGIKRTMLADTPMTDAQMDLVLKTVQTYGQPLVVTLGNSDGPQLFYTGWTWKGLFAAERNTDEPLFLVEPFVKRPWTRCTLRSVGEPW